MRIAQLQKVARVGPFMFNSIDLYAAQPTADGGAEGAPFYIHHVAYPQIDNVKSAELAAWNQQHLRGLPVDISCDGLSGASDETYELVTPVSVLLALSASTTLTVMEERTALTIIKLRTRCYFNI